MTEDEARAWLQRQFDVSRETWTKLEMFVRLLIEEASRQNLIASSTFDVIWSRHIVDSAQLLSHVDDASGRWLDVGSGAGLPGLVLAILYNQEMTLVDSRRLRTAFLAAVAERLGLANVTVHTARVETLRLPAFAKITARAVAPLTKIFGSAQHLSTATTQWLLPKGRSAASELAEARKTWQGRFVMQPSITDPAAAIVVASDVFPRRGRA